VEVMADGLARVDWSRTTDDAHGHETTAYNTINRQAQWTRGDGRIIGDMITNRDSTNENPNSTTTRYIVSLWVKERTCNN